MPSRTHIVCIPCRVVFKGAGSRPCPKCRSIMRDMGTKFKTPKKSNDKEWKKIEILVDRYERTPYIVTWPMDLATLRRQDQDAGRPTPKQKSLKGKDIQRWRWPSKKQSPNASDQQ